MVVCINKFSYVYMDPLGQIFQSLLITEYTLNHMRDPATIYGIFLNLGVREGLPNLETYIRPEA